MIYLINGKDASKDLFYTMLEYCMQDLDNEEKKKLKSKLHHQKVLCINENIFEKV